jgi:hypothetical protein
LSLMLADSAIDAKNGRDDCQFEDSIRLQSLRLGWGQIGEDTFRRGQENADGRLSKGRRERRALLRYSVPRPTNSLKRGPMSH